MSEHRAAAPGFTSRSYWIHAITPLHVGAGRGFGFIDLPIMREAVTNWPFVPGSAMKGVLADYHGVTEATRESDAARRQAFGRGGDDAANSGSLVFTDAHLVCLPVRSLFGTFAWCTCPLVLERLRRDLVLAGFADGLPPVSVTSTDPAELPAHVTTTPASVLTDAAAARPRVYFEDLDLLSIPCETATRWAEAIADGVIVSDLWRTLFMERFAVVPDDVFNFLCETATQVDARVRIDDNTKTVADGQLWYEESLPAEALLAGLVWCGPVFGDTGRDPAAARSNLLEAFCAGRVAVQLGGKATVGRGQVYVTFGSRERDVR